MQLTLAQRQSKQQEANELASKLSQLREDLGRDEDYTDSIAEEGSDNVVIVPAGIQQFVCTSIKHKIKEVINFRVPQSREKPLDEYICKCGIIYKRQI